MANKYTVSANFTVTSSKSAPELLNDVYTALQTLGSNCLINQMNYNQWVDNVNSAPQVFNDDGTPVKDDSEIDVDIVETAV